MFTMALYVVCVRTPALQWRLTKLTFVLQGNISLDLDILTLKHRCLTF